MTRIRELDGLRGLAVLLVVVWHYLARTLTLAPRPHAPGVDLFIRWTRLTWSGVDLFFVLSGFLIGGILLKHRAAPRYFSAFYIRRACRILPLYFAMVALFFVLRSVASGDLPWLFASPHSLTSYLTLTQNFAMGLSNRFGPNWLGVTWSLAIEEHFYLILPLLVRRLPDRALVPSLLGLCAVGPIARYHLGIVGAYVYTFARTDALMIGVLLAWMVSQPRLARALTSHRRSLALMLIPLAALWAYFTTQAPQFGRPLVHLYLAVAFGTLVLASFLYRDRRSTSGLRSPVLVWLGLRSYGIYLLHQPVAGLVYGTFDKNPPSISSPATVLLNVVCWVLTLALAECSYRFFEAPFLRFGHRRSYSGPAPPGSQQVAAA